MNGMSDKYIDVSKIINGYVNQKEKLVEVRIYENKLGKFMTVDSGLAITTIPLELLANDLKKVIKK